MHTSPTGSASRVPLLTPLTYIPRTPRPREPNRPFLPRASLPGYGVLPTSSTLARRGDEGRCTIRTWRIRADLQIGPPPRLASPRRCGRRTKLLAPPPSIDSISLKSRTSLPIPPRALVVCHCRGAIPQVISPARASTAGGSPLSTPSANAPNLLLISPPSLDPPHLPAISQSLLPYPMAALMVTLPAKMAEIKSVCWPCAPALR